MRTAIGFLLRVYSYLFHFILGLFLIGIATVADMSAKPLKMDMLPWEGMTLNHWVLGLGVLAVFCVLLAVTGIFRFLLPLWALFVFIVMFRGFFLTPYDFGSADQFHGAAWLTFGALGAFLSSLSVLENRKRRR